jgi:RNA polymerase sigma-70 factor (ECF subfamily)
MAKPPTNPHSAGELCFGSLEWIKVVLNRRFGRSSSEDVAHSTFVRVASSTALQDIRHPKALLLTVATNLARDEYRRMARQGGQHLSLDEAYAENEPWTAPDQETAVLLKQIILSMPVLYRDVFTLSRFAGLSYEEIAERCNVSVKTVEWRMSKALAHCAAKLRD